MLLIGTKILRAVELGYRAPFESMSMGQRHGSGFPGLHGQEAGNLSWQTPRNLEGFVDISLCGALLGLEESCLARQLMP